MLVQIAGEIVDDETHLLWQTGPRYYDRVVDAVGEQEQMRVHRYIDRMDLAYAASDLVVARSGAITCSELLVTGTPSLLVPSPNVAEDHQTKNAESLVGAGAAEMLSESEMAGALATRVRELLQTPVKLKGMREAAAQLARPDAAAEIARAVLRLAGAEDSE